jgi:Fe-S cluster biosynthesis and repair protein YggX
MKKILLIPLILTYLTAYDINQELLISIENYDINKVKSLVTNHNLKINLENKSCETPLSKAYDKFSSSNFLNLDTSLDIINVLERNGARKNVTEEDFKRCHIVLKEKLANSAIQSSSELTDMERLQIQLGTLNKINKFNSGLNKIYYEQLSHLVYEFNNSLFGVDGNFIKIYNDDNIIKYDINVSIAEWNEYSKGNMLIINQDRLNVLNQIDIEILSNSLNDVFKNRNFLTTIQNHINELYSKLSYTQNKKEISDINHRIKIYKKSFKYIVKDSIVEIAKFKKLFNK